MAAVWHSRLAGDRGAHRLPELLEPCARRRCVERTRLLTVGGALLRQAPQCTAPHCDAERFVACFAPAARPVVLGAGDTAFHEGQIALGVGFDIVWCEPR